MERSDQFRIEEYKESVYIPREFYHGRWRELATEPIRKGCMDIVAWRYLTGTGVGQSEFYQINSGFGSIEGSSSVFEFLGSGSILDGVERIVALCYKFSCITTTDRLQAICSRTEELLTSQRLAQINEPQRKKIVNYMDCRRNPKRAPNRLLAV